MLTLFSLGGEIATRRRKLGLSQSEFAQRASVSRATLDALENGRTGEVGFSKITKILSVLGLEIELQNAVARRPTLDQLMEEDRDDKSLDRRR
jgi:transcriptional regulator with XRE-family HTH domain